MKSLFDLLQNYKPPEKSLNPRASLIKEFIDEINKERLGTKFPQIDTPLRKKKISIKLGVLKTNDELHRFLAECRDYKRSGKSFSQRFYGGFKKQDWKNVHRLSTNAVRD